MKKSSSNFPLSAFLLTGIYLLSFISCQRGFLCPDCNKKPPVAKAGHDQAIALPTNSFT